jgi:putative transcriptional regulator
MMNHPNRSRQGNPAANPTPEDIRAAREAARLTQAQAAALIHCTQKGWIKWESDERRIHPGLWELFLIKQGSPDAAKRL